MKAVRSSLLAALLVVAGCRQAPPAPQAVEPDALSVTRWTARTELFAEYPPLVVGNTSRFAIHLTRLDSFKPLTDGIVDVRLQPASGGTPETFTAKGPSRPGIFGVDVRPAKPGRHHLVITLRASGLTDEHQVGDVDVSADAAAAAKAAESTTAAEVPAISFLKEQQWALDFGTAVVTERAVRDSMRVPAEVVARPDGAADVLAPTDGRVVFVADVAVGANVRQGEELARLLPPSRTPSDLPQLEAARTEARTTRDLARRDRERAERLVTAGAAPQKRLEDARAAEDVASTRLVAAERQLSLFSAARSGQGTPGRGELFVLRAPITGTVAARDAATGSNVISGAVLFRLVDADNVHVVGHVPEAEAARTAGVEAGEIERPAPEQVLPAGRIVTRGRVIDPASRTVPITFALDNRGPRLPVGQAVSLRLFFSATSSAAVVPSSAIVDDAGRPIVFVQREGEAFERRAVTLGRSEGDVVQVLDGVKAGERVVTKGAYLVRLASLSTQVPAHGHVH